MSLRELIKDNIECLKKEENIYAGEEKQNEHTNKIGFLTVQIIANANMVQYDEMIKSCRNIKERRNGIKIGNSI